MTKLTVQEINPFIRYARQHQNFFTNNCTHYCYDCRLFYFPNGNCKLEIGEEIFEISDNTVIYLPPATCYRFIFTNEQPIPALVFNFDLTSQYAHFKDSLGTAEAHDFDPKKVLKYNLPREFQAPIILCIPRLFETLKRCTDEYLHKNQYYRETTSALIKLCLLDLLRESGISAEFKIIPRIIDYIHRHYQEAEITNENIAARFNYHPYYLSQLMKKATGKTLHSYLLHYRIRMAKNLLITTDWNISTVAWKSGFNSTAYFIKQFKLRTGQTPKQFQKKNVNLIL